MEKESSIEFQCIPTASKQMDEQEATTLEEPKSLIKMLEGLTDRRDNRGKQHDQAFVLACVIVALLNNRLYLSAIQRFIVNRFDWLREIFDRPDAQPISRSQLPLLLQAVDYDELNELLKAFFGTDADIIPGQWLAVDAKRLRGTLRTGQSATDAEQLLSVVSQQTGELVQQQAFSATTSHEKHEVQRTLRNQAVAKANLTLDALHTTAETLQTIHGAKGGYIVQVKKTNLPSSTSVKS